MLRSAISGETGRENMSSDDQTDNIWESTGRRNDWVDLYAGSANLQAVEPMLDAAEVTAGTRLLDVGTGLSAIAVAEALKRGAVVTGSDVGASVVEWARRRLPDVPFEVADAADLPFDDASFDAVVCGFSIFAFENPDGAFAEMYRVLAPGGRFACTTWDFPVPGFNVFYDTMAIHIPEEPMLPGNNPLMNVSDRTVLDNVMRRAGFVDTRVDALPLVWRLNSPDQLFDALASLRNFESVDPQVMASFRADVAKASAAYKKGDFFVYPFPTLLMSGLKPTS